MIYPWGPKPYYSLPKAAYLVFFTFVILSIYLLQIYKKLQQPGGIKYTGQYGLLIFIALIAISTLFSVNPMMSLLGRSLRFEGTVTLFCYVTLFFLAFHLISSERYKKICLAVIAASIPAAVYGILQHFQLDMLPRMPGKIGWRSAYSFFDNPNFFGSYIVMMLLITQTLYMSAKGFKEKLLLYACTCIQFTALVYSSTSSALVGAATGWIMLSSFIAFKRHDLWKKWLLLWGMKAEVLIRLYLTKQTRIFL